MYAYLRLSVCLSACVSVCRSVCVLVTTVTPPAATCRVQKVLVTFEHFELEPAMADSTCFDSVTLCDGSSPLNATHLLTYCGTSQPPPFLASSNVVLVLFHTDSTNSFTGFLASYSSKKLPPIAVAGPSRPWPILELCSFGPIYGAIAVPSVTRCRCCCRRCCRRCRGHRCAGGVRQWRRATVATHGEWQCKTARSGEWAQHFSNASCSICCRTDDISTDVTRSVELCTGYHFFDNRQHGFSAKNWPV